jgi:hypothetical protein
MTLDRHWLGDLGLAVLIALPLAGLALPRPVPAKARASYPAVNLATADQLPGNGRISLLS